MLPSLAVPGQWWLLGHTPGGAPPPPSTPQRAPGAVTSNARPGGGSPHYLLCPRDLKVSETRTTRRVCESTVGPMHHPDPGHPQSQLCKLKRRGRAGPQQPQQGRPAPCSQGRQASPGSAQAAGCARLPPTASSPWPSSTSAFSSRWPGSRATQQAEPPGSFHLQKIKPKTWKQLVHPRHSRAPVVGVQRQRARGPPGCIPGEPQDHPVLLGTVASLHLSLLLLPDALEEGTWHLRSEAPGASSGHGRCPLAPLLPFLPLGLPWRAASH